jgi:thioredoxin 2
MLVLKLDVDADPETARRYGVSGIPTFILFHGGRELARRSGLVPRGELESWLDRYAAPPSARAG